MPKFPAANADNNDPLCVRTLARRAKAIAPDTPFADACELLRASSYQLLAVVDPPGDGSHLLTGPLLGIVSAKTIADRLLPMTPEGRERFREFATARDVCATVARDDCAVATDTASDLCALLERAGRDAAPVVESREYPFYLGMVSRADLLRDLRRPVTVPQIGGMATPFGVYLTTGDVSGGVGTLALAATGLMTFVLHLVGVMTLAGAVYALHYYVPGLPRLVASLPRGVAEDIQSTLYVGGEFALFLLLLRWTPLAGYHAAEHQVVHAIERGEPLLPDVVRAMPRVHPRCSTNLVAGLMLFLIMGTALAASLGAEAAYLIGAAAAFLWWRQFGSFLQQHATTRPATDAQIASGIRAARRLFDALDAPISSTPPPGASLSPLWTRLRYLWHMGFAQIFLGSGVGIALLMLAAWVYPPLGTYFAR